MNKRGTATVVACFGGSLVFLVWLGVRHSMPSSTPVKTLLSNRQRPLRVWGPWGSKEKLGTKYMVGRMKEVRQTYDKSVELAID